MDWDAEGLLDGLDGDARDGRRELLDALHGDGASVDELRAAVDGDRLVLLPIERALLSAPSYTLAEVAEHARLPREVVETRLRSMGVSVPEDANVRSFGEEDVEAANRLRAYLDAGVPLEAGRSVMHVMSGAMARTAEPLRRLFAEAYLRPGDSERELGERYAEMTRALMPLVAADLDYLMRHQLRDHARNDALGAAERSSGVLADSAEVAVAFADIVGFTQLGQEVPEAQLSDIAERLDDLATEHVRRPARVVKTIGDAVMVVSPDAPELVDAMLRLVEAASGAEGFPPLRAGVAFGRAVPRLGDWFGPTVNLAARVTQRARPESVLITSEVRDALRDGAADRFVLHEAGVKRLKGIADPVPVIRVRRPSADPD
jgi:adenylate cyclase